MVDEYYTSQTCANCMARFPVHTKKHRFKHCKCKPSPTANLELPRKIVTTLGKRQLKRFRKEERRQQQLRRNAENAAQPMQQDAEVAQNAVHAPVRQGRLVTKIVKFYKNWPLYAPNNGLDDAAPEQQTMSIVWHRDIVAAKCILIKGMCSE